MKKFLLFLLFLSLFSFMAAKTAGSQTASPPSYAPNQLIVKFKEGNSPEELKAQTSRRVQDRRIFFFGFVKLFFEDLTLRISGKETPEVKLQRLENAAQEAGVSSSEKLFQESQDPSLSNFYLLKTNGSLQVPKAVELYKKLPEVESAEPNYMYSTFGI